MIPDAQIEQSLPFPDRPNIPLEHIENMIDCYSNLHAACQQAIDNSDVGQLQLVINFIQEDYNEIEERTNNISSEDTLAKYDELLQRADFLVDLVNKKVTLYKRESLKKRGKREEPPDAEQMETATIRTYSHPKQPPLQVAALTDAQLEASIARDLAMVQS